MLCLYYDNKLLISNKNEVSNLEQLLKDMGRRIKSRRKELKITQSELAEALDLSNNHISSIETGNQKPSLDTFVKLCNTLKVTPDYLLLGSMHADNISQNIIDSLRLCNPNDLELAKDFINLLVNRNGNNWNSKHHM